MSRSSLLKAIEFNMRRVVSFFRRSIARESPSRSKAAASTQSVPYAPVASKPWFAFRNYNAKKLVGASKRSLTEDDFTPLFYIFFKEKLLRYITTLTIAGGAIYGIAHWQGKWRTAQSLYYNRAIKERVFMDIAVGNKYVGRILIGLYSDETPLASENFIQLCEGYKVGEKWLGYRNTLFHKILAGNSMIAGDVLTGKGTHTLSIYGRKFPDENFNMRFVQEGDVAMVNSGHPHNNGSQFLITLRRHRILDEQNVVIGTVLRGMRIVRMIEDQGTRSGTPIQPVRIINCGLYQGADDGPPFFNVPKLLERAAEEVRTEQEFSLATADNVK
eukprot:GHVT01029950.1.p1 GENE.GHVT01029950.1~~GHVT01029950.1.p1  ORF type:complete len:330 (+),score=9.94 GHVT01029950.1:104-1093(+)